MQCGVRWYKATKGCSDCGESDPIVLEFDHVRGEKLFTIGNAGPQKGRIWSRMALWTEIQKCDVVCANCHARRTYARLERKIQCPTVPS